MGVEIVTMTTTMTKIEVEEVINNEDDTIRYSR